MKEYSYRCRILFSSEELKGTQSVTLPVETVRAGNCNKIRHLIQSQVAFRHNKQKLHGERRVLGSIRSLRHRALDEWCDPDRGVRVQVELWHPLVPVRDQFIEYPLRIGTVWNYFGRMGPLAVLRKVRSRLAESKRNRKFAAGGKGVVLEAPQNSGYCSGDRVVFFAPNHAKFYDRICVDLAFVRIFRQSVSVQQVCDTELRLPPELEPYVGWSMYSGVEVDKEAVSAGLARMNEMLQESAETWGSAKSQPPIVERTGDVPRVCARSTAVLFGFGNYAKTQILPHIRKYLEIRCIHEIDPDQVASVSGWKIALDTCPTPRKEEHYDAWFIAGYHHTHTDIAIEALRQNAYAVVEKPVATTWEQYSRLRSVMEAAEETSQLFACFHKRYSKLTEWAKQDLNPGHAVDMHCIVYEIPLPKLHWYNWPNSGSRLISNGCHWLDYFLFINDYAEVFESGVWRPRGSDVATFVRLKNGACGVMILTDTGSQRLGVRDVIELRSAGVTIRMTDATFYEAENTSRVLRRRRVNPMTAYRRMYASICRKVVERKPGDSLASLRSTELILRLEDKLKGARS